MAYGHGPHLDALAMMTGCDEQVRTEFSETLRVNYVELFGDNRNPQALRTGIEKLNRFKLYTQTVLSQSIRKEK